MEGYDKESREAEKGTQVLYCVRSLFFAIRKDSAYKPREEETVRRAESTHRTAGHLLPSSS